MTSPLSRRAQASTSATPSLLYTGFVKCKASPYHADNNPGGVVNLGTAENLICDDLVIPKLDIPGKIDHRQLQYFPVNGMPEFRAELARFIGEKTQADVPLKAEEISVMNGCSAAFCSLSFMIGDYGQHYLIPTPYYGMTEKYMGAYMELSPVGVELDEDMLVSVELLQIAYDRAACEGKRVCGVVLINPHNPTGAVYSKQRVLEVLEFAKSHDLHVIIDEIYFLSLFEEGEFESCLSYSKQWPDPLKTHFIWGFSKDFAMSGSRCAMIYSQNKNIHATFGGAIGFYHMVSGVMQGKLCEMLADRKWVDDFLAESRRRLQQHASVVMATLDRHGISYLKPRGTLFLWADFSPLFKHTPPTEDEAVQIFNKMMDHLVYIPSAKGFNGTDPRYFRIVYSVPRQELEEGMRRFENFIESY